MARDKRYIFLFLLLFTIKLFSFQTVWAQVDHGQSTVNADDAVFVEYTSTVAVAPRDSDGDIVQIDPDNLNVNFDSEFSGDVDVSDFEPVIVQRELLGYTAEISSSEAQELEGRVSYTGGIRPTTLGTFETVFLEISSRFSSISVQSNADADGEDEAEVWVRVNALGEIGIDGIREDDFEIEFVDNQEDPNVTEIEELSEEGLYSIKLTHIKGEALGIEVSVAGRSIGSDRLSFSPVISASKSIVEATSPHRADGIRTGDLSKVRVSLKDLEGNAVHINNISGVDVDITGSADIGQTFEEGDEDNQIVFGVGNTVEEIVTVTVTVIYVNNDGSTVEVELDKKPEIEFLAVPETELSSIDATSPHIANGSDPSTVTVEVRDGGNNAIETLELDDFEINLSTPNASATEVSHEGGGEYEFEVTSTDPEQVRVTVDARDERIGTVDIIFQEAIEFVDADESELEVTSPHIADGEDASLITVTLRDGDGSLIDGIDEDDVSIIIEGGNPDMMSLSSVENVETGVFEAELTSMIETTVEIGANIGGTILDETDTVEFVAPHISASNSSVEATSPHLADGIDASTVTVNVINEIGNPVDDLENEDFEIDLSGSAITSDVSNQGGGEYQFEITNDVVETITVTVTANGTELDENPEIIFEADDQVDPERSVVFTSDDSADADGEDEIIITIELRNSSNQPINNFDSNDFDIDVSNNGIASDVEQVNDDGTYEFGVTNNQPGTTEIDIEAGGTSLPTVTVEFEEVETFVDGSASSVEATSPHIANGVDASTVTITVIDDQGNPMDDVNDFSVDLTGDAIPASDISNEGEGVYEILVTNTTPETVTVTVTVDGTELDDTPEIVFEEEGPLVDVMASSVTVTSPHVADGQDEADVVVELRDHDGNIITNIPMEDVSVELSGDAEIVDQFFDAIYVYQVVNNTVETVTVTVSVEDPVAGELSLDDTPEIVFEAPDPVVDASASSIEATSPHIANGVDASTVTITVIDDQGNPMDEISNDDFDVDLSGDASATDVSNEGEGEYAFEVTNTTPETVTVTITVDGTELDDTPEIVFEEEEPVVDASESSVDATSPHVADGVDASTVTVTVIGDDGNPMDEFSNNDFEVDLTGDASATDVSNEGEGEYEFEVTNTTPETITVTVTVDGTELDDTPEIVFKEEEPVVDASASSVDATSPHLADGESASTVTITVIDNQENPMEGFSNDNFEIDLTGDANATDVSNQGEGQYEFEVTNTTPETVTVTVTVDGTELEDTPQIVFEEEDPVVDASASSVEATSPHVADGVDASTVMITLIDDQGNPMDDVSDFSVDLTGDAIPASDISNEGGGEYEILVTNTIPETITVTVTVEGTQLDDQPQILFEAAEDPIPEAPEISDIEVVDEGVEISWDIPSTEYVDQFVIYRGSSLDDLENYAEVSVGSAQFIDENPETGTNFYAVSAVNAAGQESSMSEVVSFYNSELFVSDEWIMVSSPVEGSYEIDQSATLFSFSDRYEQADAISESKGYWMKSSDDSDFELAIRGEGITETTISLNEGWNMIGALSYGIPASSIIDPSGILTDAPVYHYSNGEYISVDELNPNHGYWLYASESGTVELNLESMEKIQQSAVSGNQQMVSDQETMPLIEIRSGELLQQLLISDGELSDIEKKRYLLPPKAPEMALDTRSQDGLKVLNSDGDSFTVQSTEYPVSITLEDQGQNVEYQLILVSEGVERTIILDRHQSAELMQEYDEIILKKSSSEEVIGEHKLLPNYPNPFNPATTIQYRIMENTHVNLEVFDVSGRRVQVLADEVQQAGHYRTEFDGSNLASGIYMVRLRAGNQVQIQKISLIK